jgi:hypothetical protein
MRTLMTAVMAVALIVPAAFAGPSIVGDFQGWAPADPAYDLALQPNGVYTFTDTLAPGTYLYKAVDGDAWGLDFPGSNQTFTFASRGVVTWHVNLGATAGVKEGDEYVFHSMNPPIVCGDFMSEIGGVDWDQTNTTLTVMTDPDGDGIWHWEYALPSGYYQFKVVLNNNWDQDTYPPSKNHGVTGDGVSLVDIAYDMATNQTIILDVGQPQLLGANVSPEPAKLQSALLCRFSRDMDPVTAEDPSNYDVGEDRATVLSATLDPLDQSIVELELSPGLTPGTDYQVTVTGVEDTNGSPIDPEHNTACVQIHEVVFELNMHLYVDANGLPATVNIQGDIYPMTWNTCEGWQAYDDGVSGGDAVAGDTTYTVTHYFGLEHDCVSPAVADTAKYKYVADCTTWEGAYDFGHYVVLDPAVSTQTMNVWWEDVSPVDNTACDVGVRFQLANAPACTALYVRGTELPLDWSVGVALVDDGTGGDLLADDGIYSALVTFPTGTYKYLGYKYFCAYSDTSGIYECDTYPDRALTLDDVNGCMAFRAGPMEVLDLWDWCEPVTSVPEGTNEEPITWGALKARYDPKRK